MPESHWHIFTSIGRFIIAAPVDGSIVLPLIDRAPVNTPVNDSTAFLGVLRGYEQPHKYNINPIYGKLDTICIVICKLS